jgi:hypothetical protein
MLDLSQQSLDSFIQSNDSRARMALRAAFRRSLFMITKVLVGWTEPRNLMQVEVYKERQDWIQWVVTDKKRGLLEDPRSFIKTSGCTRSVPIFCAIQRPNEDLDNPNEFARAMKFMEDHPYLRGVDMRITICGDAKGNAAKFTGSTKTIFETNPLLRWLFPELIWPNTRTLKYGSWTDEEWSLPGRLSPDLSDPFVRAAGSESKIVGGRSDGVIFNDLVGDHNWRSATEMLKQRDFVKTAPFILADRDPGSPYGGFVIVEGNRWGLDDVNSMIHDEYTDWAIWRRGIERCYTHDLGNCGRWGSDSAKTCAPKGESLWTGRYPDMASIARLVKDVGSAEMVAAQYYNDPRTAAALDENNIKDFYIEIRPIRVNNGELTREWCAIVGVQGGEEVIPLCTLGPHVISIDPAASDEAKAARTAILWAARDKLTGRRFWLDIVADRWAADSGNAERAILAMYKQVVEKAHVTPRIIIEKVAAQGYLSSALKFLASNERPQLRLPEIELVPPAKGHAKEDRITRRIGFIMSQGLLYLRQGLQLPRTETRHFPTGTVDTLDAGTQAEEVFQGILHSASSDTLRAARNRQRNLRRYMSGRTGASI